MNLLVDTSIWVRTLRPQGAQPFIEHLGRATLNQMLATTGMIRLEVMVGMRRWEELLDVQEQFENLLNLEPTSDTWTEAGRMGMRLHKRGIQIGAPDLVIAAVAIEHGLTLVHADRDFELIAKHEALKTESLLHLVR